MSDDLLKTYLDSYQQTPWAALRYLVAEANYGGRVTDELDRRVLNSYMNNFYTEDALSVANYALSPLPEYHIPTTTTLQGFKVSIILFLIHTAGVADIQIYLSASSESACMAYALSTGGRHWPIWQLNGQGRTPNSTHSKWAQAQCRLLQHHASRYPRP